MGAHLIGAMNRWSPTEAHLSLCISESQPAITCHYRTQSSAGRTSAWGKPTDDPESIL